MFMVKRKTTADDVRRVAVAALTAALDDRKDEARSKPGLTGVRAVATGAVLYTAGRAAFGSRRFIRERFGDDEDRYEDGDGPEAEADEEYDEPEAEAERDDGGRGVRGARGRSRKEGDEDEEYEEPEAEAEEGDEDEEDEEPEAEAEEGDEDEEYEEPEAEAEEDDEDEEYEEPEAEAEEDDEDEEYDEPEAEGDDDEPEDRGRGDEDDDADDAASRRPPVHAERRAPTTTRPELPDRPSRSRAPRSGAPDRTPPKRRQAWQ